MSGYQDILETMCLFLLHFFIFLTLYSRKKRLMELFYLTLVFFALIMFLMALGVMISGRRLKGSCGGVGGECPCEDSGIPNACKTGINLDDPNFETQTHNDGVVVYTPKANQ